MSENYSRITKVLVTAIALAMLIQCLVALPVSGSDDDERYSGTRSNDLGAGTVPSAPRNLVADQGPDFVWLWWDHPASQGSDLIKNYSIYRAELADKSDAAVIEVLTIGPSEYGVNWYNDSFLAEGTYYYQMTADSDAGSSTPTDWVTAVVSATGNAPSGPQSVTAQNLVYSVQLNWTAPSSNGTTPVRFYDVIRETGGVSTYFPISDGLWDTGYLDDGYDLFPGHLYNYTVRAINSYGPGETVQGVHLGGTGDIPGAPENLTASGFNNSIYLSWDPPANPSFDGISHFSIYRNVTGGTTFEKIDQANNTYFIDTSYTDYPLINGVKYTYVVRSENDNGESVDSNEANDTPEETILPPVPYVPYFLNAYPGNNQVLLVWDTSFDYKDNVTDYAIFRSTTSDGQVEPPLATVPASDAGPYYAMYYDNTSLNGVPYYYTVKAINTNDNDIGPMSEEASATPSTGNVPDAPTGLIATPRYSGVGLYLPFAQTSSAIFGYEVWRANSSTGDYMRIENVTNLPFLPGHIDLWWTETTAEPSTTYFYKVKVVNMYGASEFSNVASSFPSDNGDVPDPVTDLNAAAGNNLITLTWTNPTYQGTANLLYYEIMRNNGSGWLTIDFIDAGLGPQTYDDTSIQSGMTYTYMVWAANYYGDAVAGSNTDSASVVITPAAPSKPLNLVTMAGSNYVVLTWDPPSDSGTSVITGYKVYRGSSSGSATNLIGSTAANVYTFNDTTAVNGQTYWYAIKAENSVGLSPASDAVSASPLAVQTPPGAPMDLVASPGNGQIVLTWSAPTSDGGASITRYDIFRGFASGNISGTALTSVNMPGDLTYTDDSALNGIEYWYVVKAVNSKGSGPASTSAHTTPSATGTAPGAPLNPTATGHAGYVIVIWEAPSNLGSGVSSYQIFRATTAGGQGSTALASVSGALLTYNDTSVTAGTPYFYKVRAINSYGNGPLSVEVNATASGTNVPSVPTNLVATPGEGKVILTWDAPASDGGSAITGYKVMRGSSSSSMTQIGTTAATTRSYTDSDVTEGQTYYYSVVAVNANGEGSQTSPVDAIPEASDDGGGGSDNTWLYVGIGVVAVAAIGGLAYFFMRKK